MNRFFSLSVTLVLILTLAGCGAGTAVPTQPEITPAPSAELTEEPLESTASAVTSEPVQTGLFAEQIFSGADGDIHYSYYLPDSYDGSRKFPMMVVMPGYNMMWFGEDSSGSNLNWSGFTAWTRLDTEMVVVSAQLTDWGEKSARQAIELTEYFINRDGGPPVPGNGPGGVIKRNAQHPANRRSAGRFNASGIYNVIKDCIQHKYFAADWTDRLPAIADPFAYGNIISPAGS